MIDKVQAIRKINSQMPYLKDKFFVKKIGIFGSVAKEQQKAKSDVDVLVEFAQPIGIFDFIRLEDYLSRLLNSRVDLVTKSGLKAAIKDEILSQTLYA